MHKSKISQVNYGPFGRRTGSRLTSFDAFRDAICTNKDTFLTEWQRLKFALNMTSRPSSVFKYQTSHIIFSKRACMVLQMKAFYVGCGEVREIATNDKDHVLRLLNGPTMYLCLSLPLNRKFAKVVLHQHGGLMSPLRALRKLILVESLNAPGVSKSSLFSIIFTMV